MDIAKDGYVPRGSEFEFLRLSAGSGAEIVSKLLIPRDIWPDQRNSGKIATLRRCKGPAMAIVRFAGNHRSSRIPARISKAIIFVGYFP